MIIWFTGQPNSGKTTLALELVHSLHEMRKDVTATIVKKVDVKMYKPQST
jgi:adenylylsulfate kinase-like enzyme